jgi:hypothetical protein
LRLDSAGLNVTDPVTLNIYDVNTNSGDDTTTATLVPLFAPARLLASRTFAARTFFDTASVQLPSDVVFQHAQQGTPMRLGLQVTSAKSVSFRLYASATVAGPYLSMRVTTTKPISGVTAFPYSRTPTNDRAIANNLSDFTLVVNGAQAPPAGVLAVGGIPAVRAYFKFDIPSRIIDSSLVIRATLLLNQQASGSPGAADSMLISPVLVVAGPIISDPAKAAQIISSNVTPLAPLVTHPQDVGVKEIEIAPVFKLWALQAEAVLPRAIVLHSAQEGTSPQQALFYSTAAAPELRPKLRISYTPRTRIGTP